MSSQAPSVPIMGSVSYLGPLQLSFAWRAPVDVGSAPITTYQIRIVPENGEETTHTISSDMVSYTINNLMEDKSVQAFLKASNDNGATYGPELAFPATKPIVAPKNPPMNAIAKVLSPGVVHVSWAPSTPENDELGYYQVMSKSSKTTDPVIGFATRSINETSCEISGLNTSSTYTFTVVAVNNAGQSPTATSNTIKF
jgi:hypothetical protein